MIPQYLILVQGLPFELTECVMYSSPLELVYLSDWSLKGFLFGQLSQMEIVSLGMFVRLDGL